MSMVTLSPEEMLATCMGWHEYIQTMILTIPWFISAAIFGIGQVYGSWPVQLFSGYLFLGHYQLLAINVGIGQTYPDPWCPLNEMLAGASSVSFYVFSTITFVLTYMWYKRQWPRTTVGMMIFLAVTVPPGVLVWFGLRTVESVALTGIASIFATSAFFSVAIALNPEPQYTIRTAVVEYFHYNNADLILTEVQASELALDRRVTAKVDAYVQEWRRRQADERHLPPPTPIAIWG